MKPGELQSTSKGHRVSESLVSRVPLFASLPPSEIQHLVETLRRSKIAPGAVLFHEGDYGDRFYIVLTGELEIVKALGTADERLLDTRGPGEFVGEMSLLIRDGLRTATVRAQTAVQVLEMTRADFDALLQRQPTLAYDIARVLSQLLQQGNNATIRDLQEKNRQLTEAYEELQAAQAQLIEKERMEQELQVARNIQQSILPRILPHQTGWQVAATYRPARAVGGDFYDFLDLPDGRLGIVIGDVTGKGVGAALVMATTRSILRGVAQRLDSPGEVLAQVNRLLDPDIPPNMFVTCLYAILDPHTGRLQFANAGHPLPFRWHDAVAELRAVGVPLGLMPGMDYEEKETILSLGENLLLYSDGVVEAHNSEGEMYGIPRLRQLLVGCRQHGPALIDFLMDELEAFTGVELEQEDDITLVALQRGNQ